MRSTRVTGPSTMAPDRAPRAAARRWLAAGALWIAALALAGATLRPDGALAVVNTGTRSAFLIGNAGYPFDRLENPLNDVRAMDSALRELGFDTHRIEDADHVALKQQIYQVISSFPVDGVGLFYYAGHAIQYRGVNYLLPVDFDPDNPASLTSVGVPLDTIVDAMRDAKIGMIVIILDACRNYPFGQASDAFGSGLAEVASGDETLIAYATAAGASAYDGLGTNSPYTAALVSVLEEPGLDLYGVFRKVRGEVREATGGLQRPWISGSLETPLILRAPSNAPPPVAVADAVHVDETLWNTIEASKDPGDFKLFLEIHPESAFAPQAELKLASLNETEIPPLRNLNRQVLEIGTTEDGRPVKVTECDLEVSAPDDPLRIAPGIHPFLVNTRHAIRACALAVSEDPANPRLNSLLGRALFLSHRYAEARPYQQKAMELDYPAAFPALAKMYRQGLGVAQNAPLAYQLYQKGALRGLASAKDALAVMYREGWGIQPSPQLALYWYELAAGDNYAPALDALSSVYRNGTFGTEDPEKAFEYARLGASLGDSNAMMNLGRLYLKGSGVAQDRAAGIRWLKQATERGNPFAPYHLSDLYLRGDGVEKDPVEALDLLQLSVDRGFEWALYRLGRFYESGQGGGVDRDEAYYYYSLAVAAGELGTAGTSRQLVEESEAKLSQLGLAMTPQQIVVAERRTKDWIKRNGLGEFETSRFY